MKKIIVLLLVVCACLMIGTSAFADGLQSPFIGILDAQMFATGGEVTATIGPSWAGYTNVISLYTYKSSILTLLGELGSNKDLVGTKKSFGTVSQGTEIIVGIYVTDASNPSATPPVYVNYYSGSRGTGHSRVDFFGQNPGLGEYNEPVLVGFEDLTLPSDQDYNDAVVVSLSGVTPSSDGTPVVPEPGSILAALSILGPAGLLFRRRK